MTVLLDTGPLVAYLDENDPYHEQAASIVEPCLRGEWGLPVSADLVLDEGMALLQVRTGDRRLSRTFASLFWGPWPGGDRPFEVVRTGLDLLEEATGFHLDHYDQGISLTDAALILHARRMGASIATLNQGFSGLVETVTA